MLQGKVALITGACGDLGFAIAELFAKNGATIIANDIRDSAVAQHMLENLGESSEVRYFAVDVTDRTAVDRMILSIADEFGAVDLCIGNAGIVEFAPFLEVRTESWKHQLDTNLTGCFNVAQETARLMVRSQRKGRIIFTSSWVQDVPAESISAYCTSKSGLKMLAKCMALELGRYGINVNLVAPGNVDAGLSGKTYRERPDARERDAKMAPLGYVMSAQQVAEAVLYLCSPGADYMTGATLLIDGGNSLFRRD
jgi:NAD(P)-dependent dehydrogenase (short-subunit alcohol dehydrogenase family)